MLVIISRGTEHKTNRFCSEMAAQCINTAVTPSIACVCVEERSQICPSDCACPAPIYQQLEITAINQAGACQETADETC